jgi:hypothetical protein
MGIILSPEHGLNPSLECCFFCLEPRGVVLHGQFNAEQRFGKKIAATLERVNGHAKAPRKMVIDKEPCSKCKELMEKGIILISVDSKESPDNDNPYRTGGWIVVKEEAVRRIGIKPVELEADILKRRVAFVPDDAWDMLGLPRGPVEGVPSE